MHVVGADLHRKPAPKAGAAPGHGLGIAEYDPRLITGGGQRVDFGAAFTVNGLFWLAKGESARLLVEGANTIGVGRATMLLPIIGVGLAMLFAFGNPLLAVVQ